MRARGLVLRAFVALLGRRVITISSKAFEGVRYYEIRAGNLLNVKWMRGFFRAILKMNW